MSHYLIEQLATKRNIAVETQTSVTAVGGGGHLERITTRDERSGVHAGARRRCVVRLHRCRCRDGVDADGLQRDARGYVCTGRDLDRWPEARAPFPLETSVPGIFAAGDVRSESVKRVASSVGEGSMVIAFIHEYLALSA